MKVHITTLGCKVNQYESGQIAAKFLADDHEITKNIEDADMCIVNTCAVTSFAEKKSRYQIAHIKRQNPNAEIIVCGCAAERNLNEEVCKFNSIQNRKKTYIKVQDGCNNFCAYCIVPYLRGRSRSRSISEIVAEIQCLTANKKELVIVGIDLSDFKPSLGELCTSLDKCGKVFELSSLEVGVITTGFLNALKGCKNFIPHFHLSLQSGSDRVLVAMNRKYTSNEYFEKVKLIRGSFPHARITTDIICGFPTETDAEHNETVAFVKRVGFSHAHVFPYSRRTGTKAAGLPQVQDYVITARTKQIAELFHNIK